MRISDWSSDVCASDLLAEQRHHASGRIEHVAEAHGDEPGRQRIGHRLADHLGQALACAQDVGRVDGLVGGNQHERADAGLRSEEHTSELQSLMRISYAVFCLKTKIKNKY